MGNSASAQHIADELRAARGRRRLTRAELAKRSKLAVNTIARLENGERDARVGQLIALAEALDMSPHAFLPQEEGK